MAVVVVVCGVFVSEVEVVAVMMVDTSVVLCVVLVLSVVCSVVLCVCLLYTSPSPRDS